jgi:protein arginine kinase activator
VFRRVQGGTRHVGRKAAAVIESKEEQLKLARIRELKQTLQESVAKEAYEQAAKIRDEIRLLEKQSLEHTEEGTAK